MAKSDRFDSSSNIERGSLVTPNMYKKIRDSVSTDMISVDQFIIDQLHSRVPLVENIGHYIVDAGGKRLRPILVLLAARCCNISDSRHINLAAVIEFIHTATLLHDDVVDMSALRRGRPTVSVEWNNPSSVLVGDFIYSRAFQLLVEIGEMKIMHIFADTTNRIAEGEVLQLINKNNPEINESSYREVIHNKTAILFQAAAHCAALLSNAPDTTADSLKRFGKHIGSAFQLVDDALDYDGDTEILGKNLGDDLAEGKPTLPLIHALQHADNTERDLIRQCLIGTESIPPETLMRITSIIRACGSLQYTRDAAEEEARLARQCVEELPVSPFTDTLKLLAEFSVARNT